MRLSCASWRYAPIARVPLPPKAAGLGNRYIVIRLDLQALSLSAPQEKVEELHSLLFAAPVKLPDLGQDQFCPPERSWVFGFFRTGKIRSGSRCFSPTYIAFNQMCINLWLKGVLMKEVARLRLK
jgi:hypothetical protein